MPAAFRVQLRAQDTVARVPAGARPTPCRMPRWPAARNSTAHQDRKYRFSFAFFSCAALPGCVPGRIRRVSPVNQSAGTPMSSGLAAEGARSRRTIGPARRLVGYAASDLRQFFPTVRRRDEEEVNAEGTV